ncbi:MAG: tripartite tricarboxylate transporter permease [Verrucomicrobiota bacterium]
MSADLLIWIVAGTALGITVGAIPGLTGAMVIALAIPMTFGMEPEAAMALLVSMYVGSVSGGLMTATLLKMPGTPSSIMTTLDAYPMANKGQPRRALSIGILASLVGGVFSWGVLVLLARPIALVSLKMGPMDTFALVMLALALVVAISRGNLLGGFLSLALGMLFALPGVDPATGQTRLTLGFAPLGDGLKQLPVLIGLFALPEALRMAASSGDGESVEGKGGSLLSLSEWRKQVANLVRSSSIGSFIGVLPGIGANIGSLLAYGAAKSAAADRDRFGEGAESAIVASESANNATVGGALVPLVSLGIPGSVIDAILLTAFIIHGLQPGPLLYKNSPEIVETITWSYLIANGVMFLLMWFGMGLSRKLMEIPKWILLPLIFAFCVVGSYAFANRMFDVWVMLVCGVVGVALQRLRIPIAPFVLGFVLMPMAESNLVKGLGMGQSWFGPFSGPVLLLALFAVLAPVISPWLKSRRERG